MKKKRSQARLWAVIILSALVVALLVVFFGSGRRKKAVQAFEQPPAEEPAQSEKERGKKKIILFFLAEDDDLLHPEEREIYAGPSLAKEAERVVDELIKGSAFEYLSPLPPETRLRQLFMTKEGIAYVDFTREIIESRSYGSSDELATIYSVVNSLTYNFSPIKRVVFLVEGSEKDTLAGHIDLGRAIFPDYSLIAPSPLYRRKG